MMHSFYLQLSNTWWVYLSPEIKKIGIQGLQTAFHFLQPNLTCAFTICTQGCTETVYILYTLAYLFRLLRDSAAGWRINVKKEKQLISVLLRCNVGLEVPQGSVIETKSVSLTFFQATVAFGGAHKHHEGWLMCHLWTKSDPAYVPYSLRSEYLEVLLYSLLISKYKPSSLLLSGRWVGALLSQPPPPLGEPALPAPLLSN